MLINNSFVSNKAKIHPSVKIGPFCYIGDNVKINKNCLLKSHVSILGNTEIGEGNIFFPFSSIGSEPQDLKFENEKSYLIIGNKNTFRENVTISKGTLDGGMLTQIGDNNLLMTGVHVAHDCKIGNKNILVNQVTLGGHVNIMNSVVIGGLSAIIQFVTIGSHTMIGGMSGIDKNVLPFSLVIGNRAKLRGLNLVGIRRNNFSKGEIERIKEVHKCIFSNNFDLDQKTKIDQFFIEYKSLINEKLGHIQE